MEHVEKLIKCMSFRVAQYISPAVPAPEESEFLSSLETLEYARKLEAVVNDFLLDLHSYVHFEDFESELSESEFLGGQVEAINGISRMIPQYIIITVSRAWLGRLLL